MADSEPCSTPERPPTVSGAPWRPVSSPSPAASTPTSSTPASSTNPANMPIEFEPPPTHAIARSGSLPVRSSSCARVSSPMTRCRSRTIAGYAGRRGGPLGAEGAVGAARDGGVGPRPDGGADDVVRAGDVRDPVANRLGDRPLQRPRARLDRHDARAEELHALHVGLLAAD